MCGCRVWRAQSNRPGYTLSTCRKLSMQRKRHCSSTIAASRSVRNAHNARRNKTIMKRPLIKKKAMAIDGDCMDAAAHWGYGKTRHAALEDSATPELSMLPVAPLYGGSRHEEQEHRRQYDTVNRAKAAKKLEQEAQALNAESERVIQMTASACNTAQVKVQRANQENINELNTMLNRPR